MRTYTHLIRDIDEGRVWKDTKVPAIGREYWALPEDASMRDLILAIRADEACHSHVNHTLKTLRPDEPNPFVMVGPVGRCGVVQGEVVQLCSLEPMSWAAQV